MIKGDEKGACSADVDKKMEIGAEEIVSTWEKNIPF